MTDQERAAYVAPPCPDCQRRDVRIFWMRHRDGGWAVQRLECPDGPHDPPD